MLARTRQWLRALLRRSRVEAELDEELRYHLEREIERGVAAGLTPEEARFAALREFGNVESLKEESRDARGARPWEDFVGDLRYAGRVLWRSRVFAAVSVLTLALGIGGSTAIFSLLDTVVLAKLPVEAPEQLDLLEVRGRAGGVIGAPPYPVLEDVRDGTGSLAGLAAFSAGPLTIGLDGRQERVWGQTASGSYFDVVGVRAALGRTLTPADEALDPAVVVISDRFWRTRFGGRPDVLGRTIGYGDRTLTVVGVTPPAFTGLDLGHPIDLTIPITVEGERLRDVETWWLSAIVRRKPGVTAAMAAPEVDRVFQRFLDEQGISAKDREVFHRLELTSATYGQGGLRRQYSKPLLLLTGLVATVLLIACINLASLVLARSAARRREFAVRTAIGATRLRLVRQLIAESLLLSLLGTALGVAAGLWAGRLLAGFFAVGRNPILLEVQLGPRALLLAACLCVGTTVLFGLTPALHAARSDPARELRGAAPSRLRAGMRGLSGRALVVAQIVLSLVPLLCAGLFVRTLAGLYAIDTGFRPEGVVSLSVETPGDAYPDERLTALWATVLERVEALPEVRSASLSELTPLSGRDRGRDLQVPGFEPAPDQETVVHTNHVSANYFETIGTPLLRGRAFTAADAGGAPPVALLNQAAVDYYFAGRDPLGTVVKLGGEGGHYEVVGVVADATHSDVREAAPRFLYLPVTQPEGRLGRLTLAVRTGGDPARVIPAITRELRALDPGLVLTEVMTARQQVHNSLLRERLVAMLSSAFGVLGLLLAALGLFGVVSHGVARRTREIGIRMALGAPARRVRWEVMREGLLIVCVGTALGLPLGLVAMRAVAGLLYGVEPTDPYTAVACVGILFGVAAAAAFLPARRASRTDPMVALRSE